MAKTLGEFFQSDEFEKGRFAEGEDVKVVRDLLRNNADPNEECNDDKKTPLMYAARKKSRQSPAMVELLLMAGADVNATDYDKRTPLMYAAENESRQSPAMVVLLLRAGADVNATDRWMSTPLMYAARNKSPAMVERLLRGGADVNATDYSKRTPLMYAAHNESWQSPAMVELLLRGGADLWATDRNGHTAILLAVNRGNLAALSGFAKFMDITRNTLFDGMTLLMLASERNNANMVNWLLERKANVNQKNEMRPGGASTALMIAAQQGNCRIIMLLLEHGADINAVNTFLKPALLFAAEHRNASLLVPLLLSCGANIDAQELQNCNTALTIVVKNKKSENTTKLLKLMTLFKPNTLLKDYDGNTALAIVVKKKESAQQTPGKNEDWFSWVDIEVLIRDVPARQHAYMSNIFATLTMFFVILLPTRSWKIPGRRMPTNYIALFCLGLLLCAFVYLRADFLLVLSAPMHFVSQRAESIRKYLDSFVDQSDTAAIVVKWFYVAVSIFFSWWMRRIRPVITATPISGKFPSPKLDNMTVEAIHAFAEKQEKDLKKYLTTSQDESVGGASASISSVNNLTAESSGKSHRPSSMSKELMQQWVSSLLPHALGCCKTYVTIHLWIFLAHKLSGLYSALFAPVPESIYSLVLPAILCYFVPSLGGQERKLGIYTCLVILCSCFGTFSMILFWINMCLNLHLTYVRTQSTPVPSERHTCSTVPAGKPQPAVTESKIKKSTLSDHKVKKNESAATVGKIESTSAEGKPQSTLTTDKTESQTLFQTAYVTRISWSSKLAYCTRNVFIRMCVFRYFVIKFWYKLVTFSHFKFIEACTKFVSWIFLDRTFVAGFCTKLLAYHCDITSLILIVVMFLTLCELYNAASIWAHGDDRKAYRFERGDAYTQLEFVRHKWRVFSVMFAAAALCTMGQMHTSSPSTIQPETISHVFCKTDNETQIECLVNATYFNPSESEANKCFCGSNSTEWDFCGSWQAYPVHDKFELDHRPFPADCTCSLSGPCLSADPAALVLAASQHNTKASRIVGIDSPKIPILGYSVFSPYEFLSSASLIRNGFQCRFRSDHGWEPNVTKTWPNLFEENHVYPWDNPMHFIARVSISVFGINETLVYPKEVHMKITPGMLTKDRPAQNVEATQSSEECKMEHPELSNEQLMKLLLQRAKQGELTTLDADSFGDEGVKELKDVLSQLAPTRRPTQKPKVYDQLLQLTNDEINIYEQLSQMTRDDVQIQPLETPEKVISS